MITPELINAYRAARVPHFSPYNERRMYVSNAASALNQARHALRAIDIRRAWEQADGYICADYEKPSEPDGHYTGLVRIVCMPDDHMQLDDLLGDSFDPKANPGIKPEILEREREDYIARLNQEGVWGFQSEYWDGSDWRHSDSIWGFVGSDATDSGYDIDLMQSALDSLNAHNEAEARKLEASRPDMY